MLKFLRHLWSKRDADKVVKIISSEEPYEINTSNIRQLYQHVRRLSVQSESDISIRQNSLGLYRTYHDLIEILQRINIQLSNEGRLEENYSLNVFLENRIIDEWMIDEKGRREDYRYCMSELTELVEEHLTLLESVQDALTKRQFESTLMALFTVHSDILSVAEVHIRHYSQR